MESRSPRREKVWSIIYGNGRVQIHDICYDWAGCGNGWGGTGIRDTADRTRVKIQQFHGHLDNHFFFQCFTLSSVNTRQTPETRP